MKKSLTANTAVLAISLSTLMASAASFDCAKATSRLDNAICASPTLSKLDSDLADVYGVAVRTNADPEGVKTAQRAWLRETRGKCVDTECLEAVYKQRIAALRGPEPVGAPSQQETENDDANIPSAEQLALQNEEVEKEKLAQEAAAKAKADAEAAELAKQQAAKAEAEKKRQEDEREKLQLYLYIGLVSLTVFLISLLIFIVIKKLKNKKSSLNSTNDQDSASNKGAQRANYSERGGFQNLPHDLNQAMTIKVKSELEIENCNQIAIPREDRKKNSKWEKIKTEKTTSKPLSYDATKFWEKLKKRPLWEIIYLICIVGASISWLFDSKNSPSSLIDLISKIISIAVFDGALFMGGIMLKKLNDTNEFQNLYPRDRAAILLSPFLIFSLFPAVIIYLAIGYFRRCPECNVLFAATEIDSEELDRQSGYETVERRDEIRVRTDDSFNNFINGGKHVGNVIRQEQVRVTYVTRRVYYECSECCARWNKIISGKD